MKIKQDHMVDFLLGFFSLPFIFFIFNTTIALISSPQSISEGIAIVYIALITGTYYIFSNSEKSSIVFMEEPVFKVSRALGMILFLVSYFQGVVFM